MLFGKSFKFHTNSDLRNFPLKIFLKYHQEVIHRWSSLPHYLHLHTSPPSLPSFPSLIASQFLWFDKHIQIDNKCVIFYNLS